MSEPRHPPLKPVGSMSGVGSSSPMKPLMVGTVPRLLLLFLASLAVMLPWPSLGIWLLGGQCDRPSEAFMFLGGVTLFPLMILAIFGNPSEELLLAIVAAVWLVAAFVPPVLLRARLVSWWRVGWLLGAQALFAFAQAAMAALLIIGKSV